MNQEKPYDMAFLNKISGGDEDFIREMITTFKEVGPDYLNKADKLLKDNQIEALSKETHRIIPGVTFLGARSLEAELMLIEEYTKKKIKLEEVPKLLESVNEMIHTLIEAFENDFSS